VVPCVVDCVWVDVGVVVVPLDGWTVTLVPASAACSAAIAAACASCAADVEGAGVSFP
jgi:hypothetical protein